MLHILASMRFTLSIVDVSKRCIYVRKVNNVKRDDFIIINLFKEHRKKIKSNYVHHLMNTSHNYTDLETNLKPLLISI